MKKWISRMISWRKNRDTFRRFQQIHQPSEGVQQFKIRVHDSYSRGIGKMTSQGAQHRLCFAG